jgi:hypothetical protein
MRLVDVRKAEMRVEREDRYDVDLHTRNLGTSSTAQLCNVIGALFEDSVF